MVSAGRVSAGGTIDFLAQKSRFFAISPADWRFRICLLASVCYCHTHERAIHIGFERPGQSR